MMKNIPLVSIIIPVYKVELYLEDCVRSVLAQSYTNIEVILVNDGSPDNCGRLCDQFATQDNRVRVIHKENGGLADARNCGLDNATGEYIMFVDSDDVIHNRIIELLIENLGDSDMIFCDLQRYSGTISFHEVNKIGVKEFEAKKVFGMIDSFRSAAIVVACGKIFRRKLWDTIRFPKGKLHEDEFVIHHLIDKCDFIKFIDLRLYGYRQRPGSIMSIPSNKSLLDRLEAFAVRKQFFLEKGMHHEANSLNHLIIPKLIFPSVPKNHLAWQVVSSRETFNLQSISLQVKLLYVIKKYFFPLYIIMQHIRKRLLTSLNK